MTPSVAFKILYLATALCYVSPSVQGQWTSTEGPYGGPISSLAEFEGNLYVSGRGYIMDDGGVYRSSDNGQSWSLVSVDTVGGRLSSNEDFLFVTNGREAWRYDGNEWEVVISELDSMYINEISNMGDTLFIGAHSNIYPSGGTQSIFHSVDNLDSLTYINSCPGFPIQVIGEYIYTYGYSTGLYRSHDGTAWEQIMYAAPPYLVHSIAAVGEVLYAATSAGLLKLSDNSTWAPVNTDFPVEPYMQLISIDSYLYVATSTGVYRLSLGDSTWATVMGMPSIVQNSIHTSANLGTNLFVGTPWGVYTVENDGTTWEQVNYGLSIPISNILIHGPNIIVGGYGIYRKMGDTEWESVYTSWSHPPIFKGDTIIVIGAEQVMLSTNFGGQWSTSMSTGIPLSLPIRSILATDAFLFAAVGNMIYRSSDLGASWIPAASGLGFSATSLATNGTEIFALSNQGVFLSSGQGTTWTPAPNNDWPTWTTPKSLIANGTDLYATTREGGAFYSNGGASWTSMNTGPLTGVEIGYVAANGPNLFVSTSGQGVFWSTDHGFTWEAVNWGLPEDANVQSLATNGTDLYAELREHGVWKTSLTNVGIGEPGKSAISFKITPNPTAGRAKIDISGISGARQISLLDATGRVLLRRTVRASEQTIILDLHAEENGIYFVEATSIDGTRQVEKLVKY